MYFLNDSLRCLHIYSVLTFLFLCSMPAVADVIGRESRKDYYFQSQDQSIIVQPIKSLVQTFEPIQYWLGTQVNDVGKATDSWLSDDEYTKAYNGNRLEVSFPVTVNLDTGTTVFSQNIRAQIPLPLTANRLKIIVETTSDLFDEEQATPTTQDSKESVAEGSGSLSVGLLANIMDNDHYRLSTYSKWTLSDLDVVTTVGVKLSAKLAKKPNHHNWLQQNLYWDSIDKIVYKTGHRHEWVLDDTLKLNFYSGLDWWNELEYWHAHEAIVLTDRINLHRAFYYSVTSNWNNLTTDWEHDNMGVSFRWRERLYKKWLYTSVTPALNYSHNLDTRAYEPTPSMTMTLEIFFYEELRQ